MTPSTPMELPDVSELRSYLPALSYAVQAVREREKALTSRFEVVGARQARDARMELEELERRLEEAE